MLISDRNSFMADVTARDYVQDGLVAMWDAIENAGWEEHTNERILTNLVTGAATAIPDSGYTIGENCISSQPNKMFVLGNLAGKISTPCTITSVGCCTYRPSNPDNLSGYVLISGIGAVSMWRRPANSDAAGVVGGSIYQTDGKIHYYGAPSREDIAAAEADAEVFGVMRSRAAVIATRQSSSGLIFYYNGTAKDGTSLSGYSDSYSAVPYNVGSPHAISTEIKWGNIAVYNRALTAEEIAHNHAIDKMRFGLSA